MLKLYSIIRKDYNNNFQILSEMDCGTLTWNDSYPAKKLGQLEAQEILTDLTSVGSYLGYTYHVII